MNRSVLLAAIASIACVTPAFSQGRFGSETAQKAADRIERAAIRRAEHPELYPPAEPAHATAQEATAEPAPAEPAPATEPAPAAAPAQ